MIKFIINLILLLIAIVLFIPIELSAIIIVAIYKGKGVFNYFKNAGLTLDVMSASRHRLLWNKLFVRKNGYKFSKGTNKSISRILGINGYFKTLTIFGWIIYYFLWAVDYSSWGKGGHCRNSMEKEDEKLLLCYN